MAPTDDVEAIRAVYKRLAKQLHPDVQHAQAQAVVMCDMRVVNRARDVLIEASQRGSLVAAAGDPCEVRQPATPSPGDLWRRSPPPPHGPAPGQWWDARSVRASRSRRAAVRWLCVVAGLATTTVLLELLPGLQLDQAFAPTPSAGDAAMLAAGATDEKDALHLVFGLLQMIYPVCVVKWLIYANRSLVAGTQRSSRGVVPMAMAMITALVALFWGFTSHVTHGDDLLAGTLTPQDYADAIAWDHVLMWSKAGAVAVLAAIAILSVARPRAERADPSAA